MKKYAIIETATCVDAQNNEFSEFYERSMDVGVIYANSIVEAYQRFDEMDLIPFYKRQPFVSDHYKNYNWLLVELCPGDKK